MSHLWPDCRNPKAIDRLPTAVRDTSALAQPNYTEGASDIKISLGDEPEFQARIVGKDPETDIALRKGRREESAGASTGRVQNGAGRSSASMAERNSDALAARRR